MPHQVDHCAGIVKSLQLFGVAFDMSDTGTGKTYVACKAAERLKCLRIVVVCPNIMELKWSTVLKCRDDPRREDVLVFPYSLLTRTASTNGFFAFSPVAGSEVVINGMGKLNRRDLPKDLVCSLKRGTTLDAITSNPRTLLVLDETHKVKNNATQASRAIHQLIRRVRQNGGWVLHVSATPFDQLFQIPQYMRFVGTDRAADLCAIHESNPAEPLVSATTAPTWDIYRILEQVLKAPPLDQRENMRALKTVGSSGSDVGCKWQGVSCFLDRVAAIRIPEYESSDPTSLYDQDPSDQFHVSIRCNLEAVPGVLLSCVLQNMDQTFRTYERSPGHPYTHPAILDAILWPVAIEDMGGNVGLARRMVTDIFPRLISCMLMPDHGFDGYTFDVFLEDVDVTQTIVELVYLPSYLKYNNSTAVHMPLAPLGSPAGLVFVPEDVAARCIEPLTFVPNGEWSLGQETPVHVWYDLMVAAQTAKEKRDAQIVHEMCRVARSRWIAHSAGAGESSPFDVSHSSNTRNAFIRLELIKTPSLYSLVKATLSSDRGSKAIVMFNYKEPLVEFERLLQADREHAHVKVVGDVPPVERARRIDRWSASRVDAPGCVRILLCTIHVVNEGIDLHDTRGDERRYNFMMACPSAEKTHQAKGRIVRTGMKSHAINCVVYGGHELGGDLEERLIMRLETKNAVMQVGAKADASIFNTSEFLEEARAVHASTFRKRDISDSRKLQVESYSGLDVFSETWEMREFALRMWSNLKLLKKRYIDRLEHVSAPSPPQSKETAGVSFVHQVTSIGMVTQTTRLSDIQLSRVGLCPWTDRAKNWALASAWNSYVEGFSRRDSEFRVKEEELKNLTYAKLCARVRTFLAIHTTHPWLV